MCRRKDCWRWEEFPCVWAFFAAGEFSHFSFGKLVNTVSYTSTPFLPRFVHRHYKSSPRSVLYQSVSGDLAGLRQSKLNQMNS